MEMSLDEAIKHAEEVADEKEKEGKLLYESEAASIGCLKCAEEHRQLAEWLKDYKRLLEQESCEDWCDVPSDEMTLEQARQAVKDLRKKLAEHLEQEPCKGNIYLTKEAYGELCYKASKWNELELCEDVISRADVLDLCDSKDAEYKVKHFKEDVECLPSVYPKPNLDKIRAEIMQLDYDEENIDYDYNDMAQTETVHMICREEVLQIINKYKAESEGEECQL